MALRRTIGCAQRLSASLNSAQQGEGELRRATATCSTPFGITEFGTRAEKAIFFRIQSAQRLSASLNSAHQPNGSSSESL